MKKLSAFFFTLIILFLCQTIYAAESKIQKYFRLLPLSAFDQTTEGLTDEEKSSLLNNSTSPSWKLKADSDKKITVTSKTPFSIVVLSIKDIDSEVLEVKTQNEHNLTFQYWKKSEDEKTVYQVYPKIWDMTVNETFSERSTTPSQSTPIFLEIKNHIETTEQCHHWDGEDSEDAERAALIQKNLKSLKCESLETRDQELRNRLKSNPDAIQLLDTAKRIIEML